MGTLDVQVQSGWPLGWGGQETPQAWPGEDLWRKRRLSESKGSVRVGERAVWRLRGRGERDVVVYLGEVRTAGQRERAGERPEGGGRQAQPLPGAAAFSPIGGSAPEGSSLQDRLVNK